MKKVDQIKMYGLLEEMLKSAKRKDGKNVLKINKSISSIIAKEHISSKSKLILDYDTCRQSCVLAFTTFPGLYDKLIYDAKIRFSKIKRVY